jgi:hypothetical protein
MSNATDMSTPVTRGELREELKKLATRADLEQLAARTRADLEIWGGALADRFEQRIAVMERNLSAELAGHAKAYHQLMLRDIAAVDDTYKSLPDRVQRLEAKVFP